MNKQWMMAAALALSVSSASALELQDVYVGGGIGINSVDNFDSAMGIQLLAGMPLPVELGIFNSAVEVGFMDSGDFERSFNYVCGANVCSVKTSDSATGLWATYVASLPINSQMGLIGRVGLDFGDDDGLMAGLGFEFALNNRLRARAEYVSRDSIDSLQANLTYTLD